MVDLHDDREDIDRQDLVEVGGKRNSEWMRELRWWRDFLHRNFINAVVIKRTVCLL
jgi:hypothetical protein